MSARVAAWIECEGVGCVGQRAQFPADLSCVTVGEARRRARSAGWSTGGPATPDLCPDCVKAKRIGGGR